MIKTTLLLFTSLFVSFICFSQERRNTIHEKLNSNPLKDNRNVEFRSSQKFRFNERLELNQKNHLNPVKNQQTGIKTKVTCDYTLVAENKYPSGWGENKLTIIEDSDTLLNNYSLADGLSSDTIYFAVTEGGRLQAIFTAGEYPEDCHYKIFDPFNELVFEDGLHGIAPMGGEIGIASCTPVNFDVAILNISTAPLLNPGSVIPKIYLKNKGNETVSFDVTLNIGDNYTSTKRINNLVGKTTSVLTFDSWIAENGQFTCTAIAQLQNDEHPENDTIRKAIVVRDTAIYYAYDGMNNYLVSFFADDPASVTQVSPTVTETDIYAGTWAGNKIYMAQGIYGKLYTVDPATGSMEYIGEGDPEMQEIAYFGLAFDQRSKKLYACDYEETLYQVDTLTGIASKIGPMNTRNEAVMSIAFDGDGQLYTIESDEENTYLYTVDPISGVAIKKAIFDFAFWGYLNDMAWDKKNNLLYIVSEYEYHSVFYQYNPETGQLATLGNFPEGIVLDGLVIPDNGQTLKENDILLSAITAPTQSGEDLRMQDVKISIRNSGSLPQTNIPVSFAVNDNNVSNEIISDTVIAPGDFYEYTFAVQADLSTWDETYKIAACASLSSDENADNNCKTISGILNIKPCIIDIPENAVYEAEACSDSTNDGCRLQNPSFENIEDGEVIYGQSYHADRTGDEDWYTFTIDEPQNITINTQAEFTHTFQIYNITDGCLNAQLIKTKEWLDKCNAYSFSMDLINPGKYAVCFTGNLWSNYTCDDYNAYSLGLQIQPWDSSYCTDDLYTYGCSNGSFGISAFRINDFNPGTISCNGAPTFEYDWYHNYSDYSTPIANSDSIYLEISWPSAIISGWIDFNDDHIFESNEVVIDNVFCERNDTTHAIPVLFPQNASEGEHMMRVRSAYWTSIAGACDSYDFGNLIDFKVAVGTSVVPKINVNTQSVFQVLQTGETGSKSLTIKNSGKATLQYSIEVYLDSLAGATQVNQNAGSGVRINHSSKGINDTYILNYDDGTPYTCIGLGGSDFMPTTLWPAETLEPYVGLKLTQVEICLFYATGQVGDMQFTLYVMRQGIAGSPGEIVVEQNFTSDQDGWVTVPIENPVEIDGTDLWVGYVVTGQSADDFPAVVDDGPAVTGYGDLVTIDGINWQPMGLDYNWCLHLNLEGTLKNFWLKMAKKNGSIAPGKSEDIEALFNASGLADSTYNAIITVKSTDKTNPVINIPATLQVGGSSIGETINDQIEVYPNPSTGLAKIRMNDMNACTIKVYDMFGKQVYSKLVESRKPGDEIDINLKDKPSGIYLLKVQRGGSSLLKKIVIK